MRRKTAEEREEGRKGVNNSAQARRRRAPFEKAGSLKMGGNFHWFKMMSLSAGSFSISDFVSQSKCRVDGKRKI